MIVFQVSLNFHPVKEILKIRFIILMEKVIILKKIHVTIKSFAPPFFNHFSLSLNSKKTCGSESHHEKGTKHIHASAADLWQIRIGNINWCKCEHCKNEPREVNCPWCREVQCLLLRLKSWSAREASCHPAFMGNCPTISHLC